MKPPSLLRERERERERGIMIQVGRRVQTAKPRREGGEAKHKFANVKWNKVRT